MDLGLRRPLPQRRLASNLLAVAMLPVLAGAGCHGSDQPFVSLPRLERGLVIVLTGIEGRSPFNEATCRGLDYGNVNWAIELNDWTSMWGPLYSLRSQARNRQKASEIADRIVRYQLSYPGRPVVLVGQSGGAAMAVWAAEDLPDDRKIDGMILVDAALSPGYMLDKALKNSRRGIANFHSLRDYMLMATTVTGTMDGQHAVSAGRAGFEVPTAGGRPGPYAKLYQVPWHPRMSETGHYGLHLTSGASRFVMCYIAPLVLAETWDKDAVTAVWAQQQPASGPSPAPRSAPATRPAATPPVAPGPVPPDTQPAPPTPEPDASDAPQAEQPPAAPPPDKPAPPPAAGDGRPRFPPRR